MKRITVFSFATCVLLFITCFHTFHLASAQPEQQTQSDTEVESHANFIVHKQCPPGFKLNGKNQCVPTKKPKGKK
uniref:Putative secreted protein n=1 Tax=Anopheles darlingi TaxID=43151 RepID=A0A2M4D516_ANODA